MARYTLIAPDAPGSEGSASTTARSVICDVNLASSRAESRDASQASELEILVDGKPTRARLLSAGPPYLFSIGGKPYEVVIERPGEYRVVNSGITLRLASGTAKRAPASSSASSLVAPMPGRVVRVTCKPGDVVEAGAPLVVLEAMKMENELVAPARGRIKEVLVREGSAVEARAKLVTLAEP